MKSWPPLGAAVLLAAPAGAWALGLGDIELQSALNQPFRAEIQLLSATAEELESLRVGLASPETFSRYGLDRSSDLSALEFEVVTNDRGQTIVRVESESRIDEPFLTMLVEARWPRGRLLREYTVLLDPPSLLPGLGDAPPIRQAQTAPAQGTASGAIARAPAAPAANAGSTASGSAPAAGGAASASAAAARGSSAPASGSRASQASGASSSGGRTAASGRDAVSPGGTYGPVQSDETLWGIASALRPTGVTTNQMMVALYEANPDAFLNNMNLLRRGATLQVPNLGQLRSATPEAATAEVRDQNEAWQGGGEVEPRLRLVPPDQALSASSGAGGAGGGADASANAGAEAGAGAAAGAGGAGGGNAAAGNVAALRDQVAALQNQLAESRRLLELRDQQLQALQAQAADAAASTAAAASPAAAGAAAPGVDLESQQVFADGTDALPADAAAGSSDESSAAEPSAPAAEASDSPEAQAEAAVAASADAASGDAASADAAAAPAASPAETSADSAAPAPQATPAATRAAASASAAKSAPAPSLLSRVLGWIANPLLLIGLGFGAVLLTAVWYLRHRREEDEDVTGRWDALEAEIEEEVQAQTTRTKRLPEVQSMIVEEQTRRPRALQAAADEGRPAAPSAHESDDTSTSQTVINLDQADPVDEADFHMAYGLYDQAAELVSRALEAEPGRRDLQLKLLEVYFVWGNKDAFLTEAHKLHAEIGGAADADWDKVLIMGKQICPDEPIFAESAGTAGALLDVDLEGDRSTELDFAFDEKDSGSLDDAGGMDLDFELAATGERFAPETRDEDEDFVPSSRGGDGSLLGDDEEEEGDLDEQTFGASLDIGAQTAAGLEAALFMVDDEGDGSDDGDDGDSGENAPLELAGGTTLNAEIDGSAVTQESPTVESARSDDDDWAALFGASEEESDESEEEEAYVGSDSPTVETPTIETERADAPTVESPAIQAGYASDAPTVETPTLETAFTDRTSRISVLDIEATGNVSSDHTEEIDLDDLGLSLGDLEDLPADIGELPHADDGESDTREQPILRGDDELLSATGVTEVLHEDDLEHMDTSVLRGGDALLAAASVAGAGDDGDYGEDAGYRGTEVIEERRDGEGSGDTSLVRSLSGYAEDGGDLDLNLEELSAALEGGDTVEQPHGSSLHADFFGDGATPIDLDIGSDLVGLDDPTGTEHMRPLDPQTMTEIGTKLDLARAYIDMGDPEGARSILEEVLDEGDAGQRREAQGLIDALSA